MEELTKTQIVLLTLLVSFVTSIATGIVTVTLMDQAPPAITQTINRVVEKTIETVVPGEVQKTTMVTKEIIIREEDKIVSAVEKNQKGIISVSGVNAQGGRDFLGIGTVLSKDGLVIVDKDKMLGNRNNLIVSIGGLSAKANIVDELSDEYYLLRVDPLTVIIDTDDGTENDNATSTQEIVSLPFVPLLLADSDKVKIGQTIVSLNANTIAVGVVSGLDHTSMVSDKVASEAIGTLAYIQTTTPNSIAGVGGPVVDLDGMVIGFTVLKNNDTTTIVPSNVVKDSIARITTAIVDSLSNE
ncbi:MAG: hypothetical protein COZ49_00605 [Candidatus Yonathbacteria bacterium CG_4_10_14_3_um_filter_47_65]|uniref:Serine protease n=2 Tax=Parcubacteria group TaxID=1794811 RepID=A0A2M8D8X0_9BACT|nr:MAG: hypothetical protein AUJ44_00675 [Candidatus Nomurabacteria bacterium CG1_02_47_685]PIP03923.1 MAG: hypothetical protein COX54_01790 [Candidatus Yonathbacteria bacterium CG23_combo_of_CG06-09_8_20_14_all_46_18]PIQ31310.1 MAG: hypothetical protein COW61_03900 [Candidatus Yonathbacteria bacterium CG17_big_fil_post_rev_8_21_14_2_50_46_19]PIX56714.1 MAG: hypothetical protein COZ49_00605 [Candidatus Yonathbacteria bacterium CG_4_10_14_3_um_filter_47_65]PIY57241.1 MAG: hypothetical protein CO